MWSSKELKAEEAKNPRSKMQSGRMTVYFLTLYRFQGSRKAGTECTLKTAQPDGKHLVKKPVAKLWKQSMRAEMRQFCSWSQEKITIKDCENNPLTATQISDDQVTKGAGWMPWHWTPKKDVVSCEKPRGAASRL